MNIPDEKLEKNCTIGFRNAQNLPPTQNRSNLANSKLTDTRSDKTISRLSWELSSGRRCSVEIGVELNSRLRSQFSLSEDFYSSHLCVFLKRKWHEMMTTSDLYTIRGEFYALCRELFDVSHECFADALNWSSVLPHFGSLDSEDSVFGTVGKWEDVQDNIVAGSGVPPFSSKVTSQIISTCEIGVKRARPYLRIFLLPLNKNGPLSAASNLDTFEGKINATLKSGTLRLRHHRYFLNPEKYDGEEWRPMMPLGLVVWINEFYRISHPVSVDIEDCLTLRAVGDVGDASVLDFQKHFLTDVEMETKSQVSSVVAIPDYSLMRLLMFRSDECIEGFTPNLLCFT